MVTELFRDWAGPLAGPAGEFGRIDVLFLASGESSYVTGIDLLVDGGMKVW